MSNSDTVASVKLGDVMVYMSASEVWNGGERMAPAITIPLTGELRRGIITLAAAGRKIEIIIREAR